MDSNTADWRGSAPDEVVVQVPGEDRFLEVLRAVVGRVARINGFTFSGIEDFSLAVDEAAVLLLGQGPRRLNLRLSDGAGKVTAVVSVLGAEVDWPPSHDLAEDMRWQVLDALCEEVWLVAGDERGIGLAQSVR